MYMNHDDGLTGQLNPLPPASPSWTRRRSVERAWARAGACQGNVALPPWPRPVSSDWLVQSWSTRKQILDLPPRGQKPNGLGGPTTLVRVSHDVLDESLVHSRSWRILINTVAATAACRKAFLALAANKWPQIERRVIATVQLMKKGTVHGLYCTVLRVCSWGF